MAKDDIDDLLERVKNDPNYEIVIRKKKTDSGGRGMKSIDPQPGYTTRKKAELDEREERLRKREAELRERESNLPRTRVVYRESSSRPDDDQHYHN